MSHKLTTGQKNMLKLIAEGADEKGWTEVTAAAHSHIGTAEGLPMCETLPAELCDFEHVSAPPPGAIIGKGRMRLTELGHTLVDAMAWL